MTETFEAAVAEADQILDALLGRIGDVSSATKHVKVLVYGQPGVGKTVFCASAPKPLIVDIERGAFSIKNHPELVDDVQVMEFKSIAQLETLIKYLKDENPAFDKYETIVIDSFTELQKRDLDEIVSREAAKDASRNKFLPIGQDYNVNTEHMRKIASDLRDVNKNIIVTCHAKEEKDDTTGRVFVRPNLTPKLAGTLAGIFDLVGFMNRDESRRTLQVHPTQSVSAKTRIGGLPPVMENPKFSEIIDAITEEN